MVGSLDPLAKIFRLASNFLVIDLYQRIFAAALPLVKAVSATIGIFGTAQTAKLQFRLVVLILRFVGPASGPCMACYGHGQKRNATGKKMPAVSLP